MKGEKGIELYAGKPVKSRKIKNITFEVLRIDDYNYCAYCVAINSIDRKIVEINIDDVEEV